jgi:general secretion pathway protein L
MTSNSRGNQSVVTAGRRQSSLARAFDWWCAGLATALANVANALRPPHRFQLRTLSGPFVLHPMGGRPGRRTLSLPDNPQLPIPAEVLRRTRGSIIEIVVPRAALLERRLDPLPMESRPYLERVVDHQMEAIFPWRAADALRTLQVRARDDGRLDVSVRATARPAVAPALALSAACGAREVVVTAEGDGVHSGSAGAISVLVGATGVGSPRAVRAAVACLILLAVAVAAWTTYTHWSLASDFAALDESIAERHAALKRSAEQQASAGAAGLEARKQHAVIAVAVMEDLSATLPDDTYLTELTLDGGRVRISGVSARATDIVPLLEGSGRFRNASFYAPTTRIAGADRFSIEAVVIPQTERMR